VSAGGHGMVPRPPSRVRPPASGAEPGRTPAGLTPRQHEVFALVAAGASNREIARALAVTESTAATHVSRVMRKVGARSRTQLATWTLGRRPPRDSASAPARRPGGTVERARVDDPAEPVAFVVGGDRAARASLTAALVRGLGVTVLAGPAAKRLGAWARTLRPSVVVVDARGQCSDLSDLVVRLRSDPAPGGVVVLGLGGPDRSAPGGCDEVLVGAGPTAVVRAVRRWMLGAQGRAGASG
jgi:DNA-binding CsgD family transcriptional regulator